MIFSFPPYDFKKNCRTSVCTYRLLLTLDYETNQSLDPFLFRSVVEITWIQKENPLCQYSVNMERANSKQRFAESAVAADTE